MASTFLSEVEQKLKTALNASEVHIIDNSWQHAGHRGNTMGGSHLAVTIVSERFEGLNTLARHRLVHETLKEEMKERIHALELTLLTPATNTAS